MVDVVVVVVVVVFVVEVEVVLLVPVSKLYVTELAVAPVHKL